MNQFSSQDGNHTWLKRFLCDIRGSTAMMFAILGPVTLGASGIAIDFATFSMKQSTMQAAADAASLGAAKQLSLASSNDSVVSETALAMAKDALKGKSDGAVSSSKIDRTKGSVTVNIIENWTPFFAQYIGANITPVTATATATLAGESKLCMLALETNSTNAIQMLQNAHLQATGCGVFSNSKNPNGIVIQDAATMDAATICSSGGVKNKGGSTTVAVTTDCPPLADPLAGHIAPAVGGCNFVNTKYSSGNVVLKPGVYCGGIELADTVKAKFDPGTYILKDGEFIVKDTAKVDGTDVSFYFDGKKSLLRFTDAASISLSGAETGDMAGILFFNDSLPGNGRTHIISATNAKTLTGTIYLPNSTLKIDPNSSVGEKSAYTAIICLRVSIEQGPNLVLNSDYASTAVPVPSGIHSLASVVLSN
jgi:Flp pilus assembly protein TadG